MIYVFDSGPLIDIFRHYYENQFPTLWTKFNGLLTAESVVSVSEVFNELKNGGDRLADWAKNNKPYFAQPTEAELRFVTEIFAVPHFQVLVREKQRLQGKPVADPFVIARAKVLGGCVVTTESRKPNAARIPNVCDHFEIECVDLQGFMKRENWTF